MQRCRVRGNQILRERRSSYLQTPAKFIGEIHTVLSVILIVIFTIVMIIFSLEESENGDRAAYRIGVITYTSVALVGSVMDLLLAIFLIHGARSMSGSMCLFWWRSTFVSIILFSLLSTCFSVLTGTSLLLLGVLPNALFKPFALYVVAGFIGDLKYQRAKMNQKPLEAFELDMTQQDFVDTGGPSSSRPRRPKQEPPTPSSDEDDPGRLVYSESDPEGKSGDDSVTKTPSAGDAAVVQGILQEKFKLTSTSRVGGGGRSTKK